MTNLYKFREDIAFVREAFGPRVAARHAMYGERVRNARIDALDRIGNYVLGLEDQLAAIRQLAQESAVEIEDSGYGL